MSDEDIAALLEEADDSPEEEDDEPIFSFSGIMSDDDIAALLEEAEDTPDETLNHEALDPEMAEIANAVQAAMAQLDSEDEAAGAEDIHLAPPRTKP